MKERSLLIQRIFNVTSSSFERLALDLFKYQYNNNPLFKQYCDLVGKAPENTNSLQDLPFLPVRMFKKHRVITGAVRPDVIFQSSTTGGQTPSEHAVHDPGIYNRAARRGFEHVFGQSPSAFRWLALLPSYLERKDASLVYMIRQFMQSGLPGGGFFLNDYDALALAIEAGEKDGVPTICVGVSFALLDYAKQHGRRLKSTRLCETGGMKGRHKEITREQLHRILKDAFHIDEVSSEYGMTELLSQAWSTGQGEFTPAPTLKVLLRDLRDPFTILRSGMRGGINGIDLANVDSCAFIATDDIGIGVEDGRFRVLGRIDGSEQRGCNLMLDTSQITA